jgi:hypothetical protein
MLATESTSLQEGPDTDVMTANSGSTLCNRPDVLQCLLEVLVAGLDATYADPNLSRIRIS